MKWTLSLLLAMLIAAPALGQLTREEAKILLDASARMTTDIETIKAELAELKTEVAVLKTDVAALKTDVAVLKTDVADLRTELHTTKIELKEYIDFRITASEKVTTAEIRAVNRRVTFVEYLLIALVTALVTVLLWMLKNQWDKRKANEEKNAEQQDEIRNLRAENERLKNDSGLVSPTGGRLEVD